MCLDKSLKTRIHELVEAGMLLSCLHITHCDGSGLSLAILFAVPFDLPIRK